MAKTPDQISADILAKLAITIPGLSFSKFGRREAVDKALKVALSDGAAIP